MRSKADEPRPLSLGTHWRVDGKPKTAFPTQSDAQHAAEERTLESGADFRVYQCDVCSAWHMGRSSGRDRDADSE